MQLHEGKFNSSQEVFSNSRMHQNMKQMLEESDRSSIKWIFIIRLEKAIKKLLKGGIVYVQCESLYYYVAICHIQFHNLM